MKQGDIYVLKRANMNYMVGFLNKGAYVLINTQGGCYKGRTFTKEQLGSFLNSGEFKLNDRVMFTVAKTSGKVV